MDASVLVDSDVLDAVQLALAGESEVARERLEGLWRVLPAHDGFHRCIVAHYLADLQQDVHDELQWDEAALGAALTTPPNSFDGKIPGVSFDTFLPSLYLNLASSHERACNLAAAREHALNAQRVAEGLTASALGDMTHSAILRMCARLGVNAG